MREEQLTTKLKHFCVVFGRVQKECLCGENKLRLVVGCFVVMMQFVSYFFTFLYMQKFSFLISNFFL
ncbi:unnamed protein product [Meloidogyne enterolobii]|uniref:Uncharacterized protein n=1 Tax=Meloidogyne enterolobii TaxID=390850 RepID=A0ACB0XTI4_MELEN